MLVTSDWHLTEHSLDEYRWRVFEECLRIGQKYDERELFVLGDLTDKKQDRHSTEMINRIVDEFVMLRDEQFSGIHILVGNHDCIDGGYPFMRFLRYIPGIHFYAEPDVVVTQAASKVLMIPNAFDIRETIRDHERVDFVFMHHTVHGAVASNGVKLKGEGLSKLPKRPIYISGDIHVPQKCGAVRYCGSPHPVRFGDEFVPRMFVVHDGKVQGVRTHTIRKLTVSVQSEQEVEELEAGEGDQLRAEIVLTEDNQNEWHAIKERLKSWCEEHGIVLVTVRVNGKFVYGRKTSRTQDGDARTAVLDLNPCTVLSRYTKNEGLSKSVEKAGRRIINEEG